MSRRLTVVLLMLLSASSAYSQLQPEIRFDVLGPKPLSAQPGIGANAALGNYVRVGATAGYALRADTSLVGDRGRFDLLGRVTLDPFRQQRWALAIGGGLSFRRRTYLAAIAEIEGPEIGGFLPALQVGVSGGVRGALIIRRAVKDRR